LPPKLSFIDSRRLLQILATRFSPNILSKNEEEKENERDGRNLTIVTVGKE
jgi:hypothetical protein